VLRKAPRFYALFFVLSRTGLRLGEALALRWDDLDLIAREMRVERALGPAGEIDTPKSGHGRTVDLGASTCELLRKLRSVEAQDALERGRPCPWIFPAVDGEPMPHVTAQKAFERVLKAAGLPGRFSCHSLRHTYASLLLADGVSPAYVQEQLGHASIELTVGTYGRWLRKKAPGALDRLDAGEVVAETPKVVAAGGSEPSGTSSQLTEVAEREGFEPSVPGLPAHVISSHADSTTLASLREWPRPGSRFGGEGGIRTHGTR
jgi:integrase